MDSSAFDTLTHEQQWFIDALLRAGVSFVVVGGYAVRAHGCPRETKDVDLVVDRSESNLSAIRAAMEAVHFSGVDEAIRRFRSSEKPHLKCDDCELFAKIGRFVFSDLIREASRVPFDHRDLFVISKSQLIQEKQHWAWHPARGDKSTQDQQDIERLLRVDRTVV